MKPRVLVLADVPGWAWERKAQAYQRWLADRFDITVGYHLTVPSMEAFDLVHFFEVTQTAFLDAYPERRFKAVAGLTAHVWETWGEERMRGWAATVDALHGNSLLLVEELKQFHPSVYYTPNGVDPEFFKRRSKVPTEVVFGHVGKPNPRKGAALIIEAARAIGTSVRLIQKTSKLAYEASYMAGFYQGISVMICASNMDGTPNPMLEGAATECALLSTPIGNMPEFVKDGVNGFLTRERLPRIPGPAAAPWPMTPEQIADVQQGQVRLRDELAQRMLWFRLHHAETVEMGQAARETVLDAWTWPTQIEHVAAMWTEVLG